MLYLRIVAGVLCLFCLLGDGGFAADSDTYCDLANTLDGQRERIVKSWNGEVATLTVQDGDSYETVYKKLILSQENLIRHKDSTAFQFYYENCKKATALFSGSGAIAARYCWSAHHASGDTTICRLQTIAILRPYWSDSDRCNQISLIMAAIIKYYLTNFDAEMVTRFDELRGYFSASNKDELRENIILVHALWVAQVKPGDNVQNQQKAAEAKALLAKDGNQAKAQALWDALLQNIDKVEKQIEKNESERKRQELEYQKALEAYDKQPVWKKSEMLRTLNRLFRSLLP